MDTPPIQALIAPVTPLQQNCTLVWCAKTNKAALIDPGGEVDRLLAIVKDRGLELEKIWITHGHLDHAGGAHELKQRTGVPIEGPHPADDFWIEHGDEFVSVLEGQVERVGALGVAMAEHHGQELLSGILPAAFSTGSFLGGLLYGRRRWRSTTTDRLIGGGTFFLAGWLPLVALPGAYAAPAAVVVDALPPAPIVATASPASAPSCTLFSSTALRARSFMMITTTRDTSMPI